MPEHPLKNTYGLRPSPSVHEAMPYGSPPDSPIVWIALDYNETEIVKVVQNGFSPVEKEVSINPDFAANLRESKAKICDLIGQYIDMVLE